MTRKPLPYQTVALLMIAVTAQCFPYLGCFAAEADWDFSVEASDCVYQQSVEVQALFSGVSQFAVSCAFMEALIEEFFGRIFISPANKLKMAWKKSQHSECNVLWTCIVKNSCNQFGVVVLPARIKYAGIYSEANLIAMILAKSCGLDPFIEIRCSRFKLFDCLSGVEAPGDNSIVVGLDGQQIIDIAAFCQQHKKAA